jgi:hypothetical protein
MNDSVREKARAGILGHDAQLKHSLLKIGQHHEPLTEKTPSRENVLGRQFRSLGKRHHYLPPFSRRPDAVAVVPRAGDVMCTVQL